MTTLPLNPPPPIPTPVAVHSAQGEWLKEVMIAILALISLAALLFAYWEFAGMPAEATLSDGVKMRMANVEKVATSLFAIFAAFVGYYAGRVPAERSAAFAQQAANAERAIADQKKDEAKRATVLLAQARDRIAPHAAAASLNTKEDPFLADLAAFLRERN